MLSIGWSGHLVVWIRFSVNSTRNQNWAHWYSFKTYLYQILNCTLIQQSTPLKEYDDDMLPTFYYQCLIIFLSAELKQRIAVNWNVLEMKRCSFKTILNDRSCLSCFAWRYDFYCNCSPYLDQEKSKLDWDGFKQKEGITEELQIHNRGKDGYEISNSYK